jgi:hypothetical protein
MPCTNIARTEQRTWCDENMCVEQNVRLQQCMNQAYKTYSSSCVKRRTESSNIAMLKTYPNKEPKKTYLPRIKHPECA